MINKEKWIKSLPQTNLDFDTENNQIDFNKWVDSVPKKNKYDSVKKYSIIGMLFVFGLLFVSAVKNETWKLQKKINLLEAEINEIGFELDQELLDNEVITSPDNIERLAKENLNNNLVFYKKSQILNLSKKNEHLAKLNIKKKDDNYILNAKNATQNIKKKIAKKFENKKNGIKKIYKEPKSIPSNVKTKVVGKIKKTKNDVKSLYESPSEIITLKRFGKWSVIQVAKAILGIPVIPGR